MQKQYNSVIVRDIIKVDVDDFIAIMANADVGLAYWNNGVLFSYFLMPESEQLAVEESRGVSYLEKIVFAKYPKYTKTVKSTMNYEMPVVSIQGSTVHNEMITWLKTTPAWDA